MAIPDDHPAAFVDPLEPTIGFQLRRTSVAVTTMLARMLDPVGLRPSEASLLVLIGANPGCTQSEIGRALRVQPANLVALIGGLETAGALERTPGRGRAIALSLSPSGRALHRRAVKVLAAHEARIVDVVPEARQAEVVDLLRRIAREMCREVDDEVADRAGSARGASGRSGDGAA